MKNLFALLILTALSTTPATAVPQKTTINLAGILFPCSNCELTNDGTYRLTVGNEQLLLLPYEARRKLFEITPAEQIAKLNKTGELLRFLLSQDVRGEETEKGLEALFATEGGRSTFVLSFESFYQVHRRTILRLLVEKKLPADIVEGILKSPLATNDAVLEMTLVGASEAGDLAGVIEKQLDRDPEITLERVRDLQKALEMPELAPVAVKLKPDLQEIRTAIENTSDSQASSYREAGLRPNLRRVMRQQRLLTLIGKSRETTTPEEAESVLKDLTNAYDPALDTPSLHEAFRHLIDTVPNSLAIVAPIKNDLIERDSTLSLMLNPPPPVEHSVYAIGLTVLVIVLAVCFGAITWRNKWQEEQRIELREGLSFDERRELNHLLEKFDLSGPVSLADLKQAFRSRAKELHPDARGPAEKGESFIELQKSYARAKELLTAFRT